ncbi:MAG: flavin reductase family protein [Synergistaceae bacterium]|jgi:flavin reductase (DIM6/NTAB) family NADH-FMN oxidoreductase RutF|nr:flavin reductase family protein [Synergistaceae bacterium]
MKKNLGPKLELYPTPVVVAGTFDGEGKPNLATLAWTGVCCSEPPMIQIAVRRSRYTHGAIVERKVFSLNIPSKKYLVETDYCGIVSGRDVDKFETAGLTFVRGEVVDVPLVQEFPVSMECRLFRTVELGSHDMFVGEIVAAWVESDVLHEGRPDVKKIDPPVFSPDGAYFGIGELLGPSFSVGKKLIKNR